MSEIYAFVALSDTCRFGNWNSKRHVDAGVKSSGFDHQRVVLPVPHGIAQPGRIGIHRKRTAISEDLAGQWHALRVEKDHGERRSLNDLVKGDRHDLNQYVR